MGKRLSALIAIVALWLAYPQTSNISTLPRAQTVTGIVSASEVVRFTVRVSTRSLLYLATDTLRGKLRFALRDSSGKIQKEVVPDRDFFGAFRLAQVADPGLWSVEISNLDPRISAYELRLLEF